ncbi:hypothetical protein KEM56_005685 [Ascosphaera pollenicola]|nr:hypothetical protein KEM56_005685 [Ascosphaera pollenicola]
MALSLAAQIDSAFSLDGTSDIDNLAKSVTFKYVALPKHENHAEILIALSLSRKKSVDQQAQELHNLEARLRETEERLRAQQQQQQQSLYQGQPQPSGSSQPGNLYPRYPANSASASQTSFHNANGYPRSPVQGSSSPRPSSRTPSMQQMNQAYQYGAGGPAPRYAAPAYGQQQAQAYPYRAASGR